jgi:ribose 5-phosphate isomerase RpiB
MKHVLLIANHDGVAGIGASLVANYERGLIAKDVYDLTLAFITPLHTNQNNCGHYVLR